MANFIHGIKYTIFARKNFAFKNGHVVVGTFEVNYENYEGFESRGALSFPHLPPNQWYMVDLFPGMNFNLRGSALRCDIVTPLGPDKVMIEFRGLGLKRDTALEVIGHISKGLSFSAFEHLRAAMDLPSAELAELAGIPARTLQRRKEEGRLQPDESDRLVRLSRVYGLSLALFEGDQAQARHWLPSPQLAFGSRSPLAMTSTEVGAREVEALIGRLEHGVFS